MNRQICNLATYRYFRQPGGRRTKNFGGKNFGEIFQDFGRKNFGGKKFRRDFAAFRRKKFRRAISPKFLVNNVYNKILKQFKHF